MNIELVGVADIDRVWPDASEYIAECLRKAPMEIGLGDIWTKCRSGEWLLIVAHEYGAIHGVSVWRFTRHEYFECVNLAGNRRSEWFPDLIKVAEDIAKANGCRGLIASGRKGLIDMIKKLRPETKVPRSTFVWDF